MQNKYIEIAKKSLAIQVEGVTAIESCVDNQNFCDLIDKIKTVKSHHGKVILSGMGKSGHIANKIAATLASTGTSSFFIHPSEASHGDLGMITKNDMVILLSNSGETKELRDIIYYCKRFGIALVGIARNPKSELIGASDISIVLPNIPEANSVAAPTTSTSMMLVFGDVVAVTLLEDAGFSKEDFGIFHPGGKLGNAFIKVVDIMKKGKNIPINHPEDSIDKVIMEITSKRLGCSIVENDKGELLGIITDGDLRRHLNKDVLYKKAADIMSCNPIFISQNTLVAKAISVMNERKITSVVVKEGEKVCGILHLHDCLV